MENATGSLLGDEKSRERVVKYLRVLPDQGAIPEIRKIRKSQGVDEIVKGVARHYALLEVDLLKRRRRTEVQRKMAVYLSKVLSGGKNAEVGAVFGITVQAVTNAVRGVEKKMAEDNKFDAQVIRLKEFVAAMR